MTTVLNYNKKKSQLLLYIQGKNDVSKGCIVNTIELGFSLFFCKANFMLAVSTGVIINNIRRSIIYISFIKKIFLAHQDTPSRSDLLIP